MNFEILRFLRIETEIQGISSKTPSISKKVWNPGFWVDPMYILKHRPPQIGTHA